jgi:hypothetical protein
VSTPSPPAPEPEYLREGARKVTVTLWRSGDEAADTRRLRRAHGILMSYPGDDMFALRLVDEQKTVEIDFPNETTSFCEALVYELAEQPLNADVWVDPPLED